MWFKENSNIKYFCQHRMIILAFLIPSEWKNPRFPKRWDKIFIRRETRRFVRTVTWLIVPIRYIIRYIEISYWGIIIRHVFHVGEISAGKSSLLNFLIGRDVLPTSVRESRSVTCRLRYGTEKTAKLIDDSGNEIDDLKYDESN